MSAPFPYPPEHTYSPKLRSYSIRRTQLDQGAPAHIGIAVTDENGQHRDPEQETVGVRVYYVPMDMVGDAEPVDPELVTEGTAVRRDTGVYEFLLQADTTAERGDLTAVWSYSVPGVDEPLEFKSYYRITGSMPVFAGLRDYERAAVEQVGWMMGDLFDSTEGGPNLVEHFQTSYGDERLAQLVANAVTRINFTGIPVTRYGSGRAGGRSIPQSMRGVLPLALYVETLKHFVRSYVEQPQLPNMQVTYTDRRDYMQRWKAVLDDEKRDIDDMIKKSKMGLMGHTALIVAGGIYGGASGYFRPGSHAASTRAMKFYPASPYMAVR